MNGGHRGVPRTFLSGEVLPERSGREPGWDNDGSTGMERGEKPTHQAVDMEEGHDEVAGVGWRKLVGLDDVSDGGKEVEMSKRDGCVR